MGPTEKSECLALFIITYVGCAEETDREAQAHMAIVFLAPTEIYCAALAPDSLSHTEPYHPTFKEKSR